MSNETFSLDLNWQPQDKPFTYKDYSREYCISGGDKPELIATAAPSYLGSHAHYNPEELLIASLAGCHMLSFLALAANAKLDILSYTDKPSGSLEKAGSSFKFKEATLRPKITLSAAGDPDKAAALHDKAHHICFIANSINFPVHIEPEVTIA